MERFGVPEEVAKKAVENKYEELRMTVQSKNYDDTFSVAKMLEMPFLNIHQPLDEIGRRLIQDRVDGVCSDDNATLKDLVKELSSFKEMQVARTKVELLIGYESKRPGKTVVAHGTYTNGGYSVANAYFENGVDTVIYIYTFHILTI